MIAVHGRYEIDLVPWILCNNADYILKRPLSAFAGEVELVVFAYDQ